MDLDNPESWKSLDSINVAESLSLFPDQIRECFRQAYAANIPQISAKAIILSGMGGSSNAGKILQSLYESELKIPFEVFNDYRLPAWANSETLVIANSYSGNTEETLSAIEAANEVGAKLIGVTTGGKIGEMITTGKIAGAVVSPKDTNPSGFPKAGLGISLGALAGALSKAGILPITEIELNTALDELVQIRKDWNVKEVAKWLNGNLPVLYGARPFIGALNAGRNAMCEISRNYTQFYDFPEVDHVMVEAVAKPDVAREKMRYLFFLSKFNHGRVLTRYKVTAEILKDQGLQFDNYSLKGSTKLVQGLELAHFCAWVGFYVSILQNTDPGPEPWIIKLKESLAVTTH